MKRFAPSEDHESKVLAAWLDAVVASNVGLLKYTHIPLETPTSAVQAVRLKRMGVRRGAPDYVLVFRDGVRFIELKKFRGGRESAQQEAWRDALTAAGVAAVVCAGATEAKRQVTIWLEGPSSSGIIPA